MIIAKQKTATSFTGIIKPALVPLRFYSRSSGLGNFILDKYRHSRWQRLAPVLLIFKQPPAAVLQYSIVRHIAGANINWFRFIFQPTFTSPSKKPFSSWPSSDPSGQTLLALEENRQNRAAPANTNIAYALYSRIDGDVDRSPKVSGYYPAANLSVLFPVSFKPAPVFMFNQASSSVHRYRTMLPWRTMQSLQSEQQYLLPARSNPDAISWHFSRLQLQTVLDRPERYVPQDILTPLVQIPAAERNNDHLNRSETRSGETYHPILPGAVHGYRSDFRNHLTPVTGALRGSQISGFSIGNSIFKRFPAKMLPVARMERSEIRDAKARQVLDSALLHTGYKPEAFIPRNRLNPILPGLQKLADSSSLQRTPASSTARNSFSAPAHLSIPPGRLQTLISRAEHYSAAPLNQRAAVSNNTVATHNSRLMVLAASSEAAAAGNRQTINSSAPHHLKPPEMKMAVPQAVAGQDFTDAVRHIEKQLVSLQTQQPARAAAEVDVNRLTQQVYDEIGRKLRIERERRGL